MIAFFNLPVLVEFIIINSRILKFIKLFVRC